MNVPIGNNLVERSNKVIIEAKNHLKHTLY